MKESALAGAANACVVADTGKTETTRELITMNRFLSTSLIALTVGILPFSANATDLGGKSSATSADYSSPSWTGLWIGAVGGYQFSNSALNFDAKEVQGGEGSSTVPLGGTEKAFGLEIDGLGADGLFGELQIGFDQQIGSRFLVGIYGGLNINDAQFSVDARSFNAWDDPQHEGANLLSFEQEWGSILGLRFGVLKSRDTLLYVGGGWAHGELGDVTSDGEKVFDKQENELNGWAIEVGMETRVRELGENATFKLAGRYTDYQAITLDSKTGACVGGDTCSASLELDHDVLVIMGGLTWKFNSGLGF